MNRQTTAIIMETARLSIGLWHESDYEAFRPLLTDPEVMRYIGTGAIATDEQITMFVDREIKRGNDGVSLLWKLTEKESGEVIGFCGIQLLGTSGEMEIGWRLLRNRWGKGLATEAAERVLRYGFEELGLRRIIAIAQTPNIASIRIMQKLGMTFLRETTVGEFGKPNPEIQVVLYAIERSSGYAESPVAEDRVIDNQR